MKMSKSLGNTVAPEDVVRQYGADILRLWVAQSDYTADQRIGPEILKGAADSYRRLRNTMRFLLGSLDGFTEAERVAPAEMPELERWVLHRLAELDAVVRRGYGAYDFQGVFQQLFQFCTRRSLGGLFRHPQGRALLRRRRQPAPTRRADRARPPAPAADHMARADPRLHHGGGLARTLPRRGELGASGGFPRHARRTGATRSSPRNGTRSAASAAWSPARSRWSARKSASARASRRHRWSMSPTRACARCWQASTFADLCIVSDLSLSDAPPPAGAFTLDDVPGVAVVFAPAEGAKCARCWKILPDVGSHRHPAVCGRCDAALG